MFVKVKKINPQKGSTRAQVLRRRFKLYRGVYTRVAQELGVTVPLVSQVVNGLKRSKRVEAALQKEMARIERTLEREFGGEEAA